jgi:hypothetical protein
MKSSIFWDITPRSPLKVNRRFGGTYRLHLQGRRISQARNQREADNKHILFETSADFQRTSRCYIPEDRILHNYYCAGNAPHSSLAWINRDG